MRARRQTTRPGQRAVLPRASRWRASRWRSTGVAAVLTVLSALGATSARAMPPGAMGQKAREAWTAVTELRLEAAGRLIDEVSRAHPDDADVLDIVAHVHFNEGRYAQAVAAIDRAVAISATDRRRQTAALMRSTAAATDGMVDARSPDGRFVVSYAPGRDAILAPYALEAMAAADARLSRILGIRVPGPVRLELYPSSAALASVSSLTVDEIERTGTIALCKWDRLMVTTPRALVRGYPWMDTIAHEYVHLVLARASKDRAPVWFQEGVAKYLERTWRGDAASAHVNPAVDELMARRLADDSLIPFDQLHPSIARLPSQEDAALAFAQVATFIEAFHRRFGDAGLRDAVGRIANGEDARDALAAVAGQTFAGLEGAWRDELGRRPAPSAAEVPRTLGLRFRHGAGPVDEAQEVQDEARRFFRLGNLLFDRGRPRAASVEYEKAYRAAPDDPIVASRLARSALEGGRPSVAITTLAPLRGRYPEHAPLRALLGSAYVAEGNLEAARSELHEALRLNPFDPEPHCGLAEAAEDEAIRARERSTCRVLGGAAVP